MSKMEEIMVKLKFYPVKPATRRDPADADLAQFEGTIGGELPADYRLFLKKFGRSGLELGARFEIRDPCPCGQSGRVLQFYGFSTIPTEDIVYKTMETYAGRIPDETIPIADDPGGNLILLGFEGAATDKVWFWDHEHRELDAGEFEKIIADIEAKGVDASALDEHEIIRQWEQLFPEKRKKPARYGNMYAIADSFMEFLGLLHPNRT